MLRFIEREKPVCDPHILRQIQDETGLMAPVAALLCARGVDSPEAAKRFLHPGPEQLLDPFALPDMAEAASRIKRAVERHEQVTVFCDYDADGTCGGSALYLYLRSAGAQVDIMTPNRHREGYGLSVSAVEQIAAAGGTLIVTVDCGITNVEETAIAKRMGIDVIITDHHECGETLPDTPYIINAKRPDSTYPYPHLAGCGVAFKLIQALSSQAEAMRYIDLIAIGTITDIVPLLGENRVIAQMGLKKLRKNPSAGVSALAQVAGIRLADISSYGIGFGLGPRINAAGRMDTAQAAIEILAAQKPSAGLKQSVARLCALNDKRRQEVCDILRDAERMISQNGYQTDPVIMLADAGWNAGVIGIAAAKIADKYTRPCVLFGGEGSLIGSARSISGINMYEVLGAFRNRYEKFGGHAQAAGLTIGPAVLDELRHDVCHYILTQYDETVFVPQKLFDIEMGAKDISRRFVEDLRRLEPFGPENEQPLLAVKDVQVCAARFVGRDKKHLKFSIQQNGALLDAVSFCYADAHALLPGRADLLCEAGIDSFSGRPQLIVREVDARYDEALLQSFLDDNASRLANGLVDEVTRLMTEGAAETTEAGFERLVSEALSISHFGLCLSACTEPALRRLLKFPPVRQALLDGTLCLWDRKAFTAGNCVSCGVVPGHTRVIHVGVASPPAFFDGTLKNEYRRSAKQAFAGRDELLSLYRRLEPLLIKKPRRPRELLVQMGLDATRMAFALRVFEELELLETDKSGRILALKKSGPRKNLSESACFRSFEGLIDG